MEFDAIVATPSCSLKFDGRLCYAARLGGDPTRPKILQQRSEPRTSRRIAINYQLDRLSRAVRVEVVHPPVKLLDNGIDKRIVIFQRTLEQTTNLNVI